MIARKITGRLRQRRTTKRGRRSGWMGLESATIGEIAVRYPYSDSVLILCTLCGKNMSEEGIACSYIDSRHYEKQETLRNRNGVQKVSEEIARARLSKPVRHFRVGTLPSPTCRAML